MGPILLQPRRLHPWKMALVGGTLLALFGWSLARQARRGDAATVVTEFGGSTMGTTYSVRLAGGEVAPETAEAVAADVDRVLAAVNDALSVYAPDSEVSRFNRAPAGEPFLPSSGFAAVARVALELAERSGGAFDPTVLPLVNLWGFGPAGPRAGPPSSGEVGRVRADVGHGLVRWTADGRLAKERAGVQLDFGAVAQGYGADVAGRAIEAHGLTNYFVEVGGEVRASGLNALGKPWRIGVDSPLPDAGPGRKLAGVVHATGVGVATSGDYRNFIRGPDGALYAHIFDPREAAPARRAAGSVTVVAANGLLADGLATTLFVLGADEGLAWIARNYPDADALFLLRAPDGTLSERASPGFAARAAWSRLP